MIVIACPGQGSQTPGFLSPWLEDAAAREWLERVSNQIDTDLVHHGTVSDADTIRATNIAQPLIVAAGILTINALRQALEQLPEATAAALSSRLIFAGHSVGEITAAYGAGVFDADTAMRFVAARAAAMQQCAQAQETSMAAVLGGDEAEVLEHIAGLGLTPANYNGAGQLVVGGELAAVRALVADPAPKTRVIQLQVAGAFHTPVMAPAREQLAAKHAEFNVQDPAMPLITNKNGELVRDGQEYLELLVGQVANPVRWDLCMQQLLAHGVTDLVEAAPAGALAGLAKRGMRGVTTHKITAPADVTELLAQFSR